MNQIVIEGFGAFAGAFFSFLFLRLGEFFTKLYQREVSHYNSLITLETELNDIGGVVHDNLYIIPTFIEVITSGNIYFNNLHPITTNRDHYSTLFDLSLINSLYTYNYKVRKINDDILTITSGYRDIKNALIQRNIDPTTYKINAEYIANNLKLIKLFLYKLLEDTTYLMAKVRVQSRHDKPLGSRLQSMFLHSYGKRITNEEIASEKAKIDKELEETKLASQKENDSILKGV